MALASGSTPEKTGPRCCDSALAYNDAPAQQEQLQQVASSDAQPLAAAASACIGGEEVFEAPRAQVRCLHDHGGGNEDVYAEAVVHGITFTCAMVCVKCGRWAYQGEWESSRTTSLRRRQYGYAYPNDPSLYWFIFCKTHCELNALLHHWFRLEEEVVSAISTRMESASDVVMGKPTPEIRITHRSCSVVGDNPPQRRVGPMRHRPRRGHTPRASSRTQSGPRCLPLR